MNDLPHTARRTPNWQRNSHAGSMAICLMSGNRRLQMPLPQSINLRSQPVSHRKSHSILLARCSPEIIGGSADLTGSNLTLWNGSTVNCGSDPQGNYIFFGCARVRNDRDRQRVCPARRIHSVRCDIPHGFQNTPETRYGWRHSCEFARSWC